MRVAYHLVKCIPSTIWWLFNFFCCEILFKLIWSGLLKIYISSDFAEITYRYFTFKITLLQPAESPTIQSLHKNRSSILILPPLIELIVLLVKVGWGPTCCISLVNLHRHVISCNHPANKLDSVYKKIYIEVIFFILFRSFRDRSTIKNG